MNFVRKKPLLLMEILESVEPGTWDSDCRVVLSTLVRPAIAACGSDATCVAVAVAIDEAGVGVAEEDSDAGTVVTISDDAVFASVILVVT